MVKEKDLLADGKTVFSNKLFSMEDYIETRDLGLLDKYIYLRDNVGASSIHQPNSNTVENLIIDLISVLIGIVSITLLSFVLFLKLILKNQIYPQPL